MMKMQYILLVIILKILLIPAFLNAQQPGSLKTLRSSDAVDDAAGTGQLFENIHVPGITDNVQGTNGFALADLDCNGYIDILLVNTPPFNLEGWPPRDRICDNTIDFNVLDDTLARDKLRMLLNKGGWVFEEKSITITGSPATPEDLSQGWRGGQIPAMVDFNKDGLFDVFIGRQPAMMTQGQIPPGTSPVGCSLFLADDSLNHFEDVSHDVHALNKLAYNRQISIADVNEDGWLDIAIGADNVAAAFNGLPKSALLLFQPSGNQFYNGDYQDIGGTSTVPDFGGFYLNPAKDKAGPDITLRDADNDGDIDLFQGCHILPADAPSTHPYSPAEYRQGIFTWKNNFKDSGILGYSKDSLNGMAQEARMKYDTASQILVRMNPNDSAFGLSYLFFADVDNDGIFDILALDGSDRDRLPHPTDAGASFWYGQGNFTWTEATTNAGLNNLNDEYIDWYNFFQEQVTAALYWKPNPVTVQPGIDPQRFAYRRAYHADAAFADFNNDGWIDLVVLDRRQQKKVVSSRTKLYMNNGDGTFSKKTTEFSGIDASGISIEACDFNNDGLVDLIISGDPDNSGIACYAEEYEDKVYMNSGLYGAANNHWLRFGFTGINHARLIGSRVELFDPNSGNLLGFRGIYTNHTYKSSSALEAHFGLGNKTCADLKITLPDGTIFSKQCVQANQYLIVDFQNDSINPVGMKNQPGVRKANVHIAPNPSQGNFNVILKDFSKGKYEVFNNLGNLINCSNFDESEFSIDLSSAPSGIYFVKFIFYKEEIYITQKIIKK
jgi:hypothetical protein